MAKKKPKKLGFDPLAWMKQEESEPAKPSKSTEAPEDMVDDRNPGSSKKVVTTKPKPAASKQQQAVSDKQAPPKQISESKTEPVLDTAQPEPASNVRVSLPESLGMEQMMALHQELKQAIEGQRTVVLDGKAVESTHAVGLQLLAAFFGEIASHGAEVQWQGPSDELIASAKLLGLSETLQLPAA